MILVTGGTGILGARLLFDLVSKNKTVSAIKRPSSDLKSVQSVFQFYGDHDLTLFHQIDWINADVNDLLSLIDAFQNIDTVYHCAAVVSFHYSDLDLMTQVNVEGTKNVVNACLETEVKTLCHVSSTAAITLNKENIGIESTPWKLQPTTSGYAITKYNAELEVWRGQEEGLQVVVVNPCMILGAGPIDKSSSGLFATGKKGMSFYTKGSNAYVDVRDVSKVMIHLVDHEIFGKRFLVIGENYTFKRFFTELCSVFNSKTPQTEARPWMISLIKNIHQLRYLLTGKKPLITKETCRSANKISVFKKDQLEKVYPKPFIPVQSSLSYFAEYYRS